LSRKSQAQAIVIVAALFAWLQSARYLPANPWLLVNQKTGRRCFGKNARHQSPE
jgi:hypothetical protein